MLAWIPVLLLLFFALWAVARFKLQGPDLRAYDEPRDPPVTGWEQASPGHDEVVKQVRESLGALHKLPRKQRLPAMREELDKGFGSPVQSAAQFVATEANGIPAEWVLTSASQPDRRLLYLHGGAFVAGSPKSHRGITTSLSQLANAAVLAVDYRLLPEHRRSDGIHDCQQAYRWILANGPEGEAPAETLFVAGDSAGGNLTLMLLAWARDEGLRAAEGAVALSPGVDSTFGSPSLHANLDSDVMLGPLLRDFMRMPRWLRLWITWATNRINPSDPAVSPIFGDLAGLPPVLVHASEAELLRDDARRWVNKAREAGSPATLETWPNVVHVWHAFAPELPEAKEAYERIGAFLERCAPRQSGEA